MPMKKALGLSIAAVMVAIVVAIGVKAFFPSPTEPDIQTLCKYIAHSATSAQCTAAVAPEGFPVGNVVVVPQPPMPEVPLPVVLRSFVQTCWLDPDKVSEVAKLLNRPPADMTLPGFTANVSRKLKSGASITLAEADNLKIVAGAHSDDIKNISVSPRTAQVIQIDQAQVESLLHRPEIREDCLNRLLGPNTRLVVSVIVAKGLEYSVTLTNDDHLDLDAAVKTGYINVDGGPQVSSEGKIVTTLSEANPRVIGVVFADQLFIDDLKNLVRKGSLISAAGTTKTEVFAFFRIPTGNDGAEIRSQQSQDGSFSFTDQSFNNFTQELHDLVGPPTLGPASRFPDITRAPRASGSSTALPVSGETHADGTTKASLSFDTHADLVPGVISWRPQPSSQAPITFHEVSQGSFKVLKRLDSKEVLGVNISREGPSPVPDEKGDIVVRVQDSNRNSVVPEFSRPLSNIAPQGAYFSAKIAYAGAYSVNVMRRTAATVEAPTSINTTFKVEVSLLPDIALHENPPAN
jgi:hypothetical protein